MNRNELQDQLIQQGKLMTYKELLQQLQQLTEEQLNQDVCLYNKWEDQFIQYDVDFTLADEECDVLDLDHPIIRF